MTIKDAVFAEWEPTEEQKDDLYKYGAATLPDGRVLMNYQSSAFKKVYAPQDGIDLRVEMAQISVGETIIDGKIFNGFPKLPDEKIFYMVNVELGSFIPEKNNKVFADLSDAIDYFNKIAKFFILSPSSED